MPNQLKPFNSETGREAGKKSRRGKSLTTEMDELLSGKVRATNLKKEMKLIRDKAVELGFDPKQLTLGRLVVATAVKKALEGDNRMIELIWGYKDGKPSQPIDLDNEITVTFED